MFTELKNPLKQESLKILEFKPPSPGGNIRCSATINDNQWVIIKMTDVGIGKDLSLVNLCDGVLEAEVLPYLTSICGNMSDVLPLLFIELVDQNVVYRSRNCHLISNMKKCQYCSNLIKHFNQMGSNSSKNDKNEKDFKTLSDSLEILDPINDIKIEYAINKESLVKIESPDSLDPNEDTFTSLEESNKNEIIESLNKENTCKFELNHLDTEKRHVQAVQRNTKFTCSHCGLQFLKEWILSRHIQSVHKNVKIVKISCQKCGAQFMKKNNLNLHIKSCFLNNCHICDKYFTSQRELQSHYKEHLKCVLCNKQFETQLCLDFHSKSVHEGIKYDCELCNKAFTLPETLQVHILSVHSKSLDMFKCRQCSKRFASEDKLKAHIISAHENKKPQSEKPIIFSFEEGGEEYMIGSEVGNYLRLYHGALYKKYPGLVRRNLTTVERAKMIQMGHSKHVNSSKISLLLASQVEDILNGRDGQFKCKETNPDPSSKPNSRPEPVQQFFISIN